MNLNEDYGYHMLKKLWLLQKVVRINYWQPINWGGGGSSKQVGSFFPNNPTFNYPNTIPSCAFHFSHGPHAGHYIHT